MYLGSLNQIPRVREIKGPNVFGHFSRKVATVQHYGYFKHGPANMILHRSARFGKLNRPRHLAQKVVVLTFVQKIHFPISSTGTVGFFVNDVHQLKLQYIVFCCLAALHIWLPTRF